MLENEPDTDQQPTDGDQPAPPTAPPRRRRAASRPAGPPAAQAAPVMEQSPAVARLDAEPAPPAAVDTQLQVTAPESPQTEVVAPPLASQPEVPSTQVTGAVEVSEGADVVPAPLKKAAAKRPARKTAAKKSAEPPVSADPVPEATAGLEPPEAGAAEAPKKRAPRKRATKKATDAATPDAVAEATEPAPAEVYVAEALAPTPDGPSADTSTTEAPSAQLQTPGAGSTHDDGTTSPASPAAGDARPAGWQAPDAADATPQIEDLVAEAEAEEGVLGEQPTDLPSAANAELAADDESLADESPTAAAAESAPEPRDFGWLADPFAPPAPVLSPVGADDPQVTEDAAAEGAIESDDSSEDDSGDGGRRRRRRRGGRRRRRSGGDEDSSDSDDESDEADESAEPRPVADQPSQPVAARSGDDAASDENDEDTDGEESEGQRRRRRRRRRRGEEAAALPDDPTDVVVRVREPRQRKKAASEEVTGIQGSTRMEAKRQRRKEGRDAGRRRAPILSEAEFLARRESVNRKMIIRQREDLAQIAVLEDGILVEHYVDRDSAASLIGNVYLGRVQNVLPSMEAAFIDIGRGRNAVLYAGEVDWDSFGADGHNRKVEKVLKSGQMILVQVSKDPVGAKGARLTNHVSIPGRYVVYAPGGHLSGISRKLPDVERRRLKDILADLVGESASVIVRTAAEGASEEELVRDVNRLKAQWEDIERKVKAGNSPQLLYGEPDLTVRIVRDLFTEDFSELIIQGNGSMNDAYDAIQGYVTHVAPHLQERIHRWEPDGEQDLFAEYRLDEQIAKALERKVFLPSGGSLVIDRTEAMTVIDVNTGKFTGTGGNLEATVTSNNLEAAEEIVNQLRLRDIGGIVVIDFIDMVLPNNRELLLRRLVECLGRDRTRHQVAEVTSLGLVQMTRKRIGTGLLEAFGTECPHCLGRGYQLHDAPVDTQKQADGGSRESRPQNHRPRPGDGSRGSGPRGEVASPNVVARSGSGARDAQANGQANSNAPTAVESAAGGAGDDSGDQPDRSRSRRGRRGGRGAAQDETSGSADAGADEQDGNRAFYDERERDHGREQGSDPAQPGAPTQESDGQDQGGQHLDASEEQPTLNS